MMQSESYIKRLEAAAGQLASALAAVQTRHPCNCRDGFDRHSACLALQEYAETRELADTLVHSA